MEEVLMMATSQMQQKPLWESQQSMKQVQHHASSLDDGNIWHVAWWFDGQSVMVARQMSDDHQCALIIGGADMVEALKVLVADDAISS